ncbi:MAG: hypothetical protein QME16_03150, partial [Planctomycetota bacterium]|nr:hypothetical protein [Planctomycetota bacterium]
MRLGSSRRILSGQRITHNPRRLNTNIPKPDYLASELCRFPHGISLSCPYGSTILSFTGSRQRDKD